MAVSTSVTMIWAVGIFLGVGGLFESLLFPDSIFSWTLAVLSLAAGAMLPVAGFARSWVVVAGLVSIHVAASFVAVSTIPLFLFLSWLPAVGLLWFRRKKVAALTASGIMLYLYSTSIGWAIWVPDLNSLLLNAGLLAAVIAASEAFSRLTKVKYDERRRRVELAEQLHTQVAGALTRALLELGDPESKSRNNKPQSVESDIRSALLASRRLLEVLTTEAAEKSEREVLLDVADMVEAVVEDLIERGFTVTYDRWDLPRGSAAPEMQTILTSALAEISQNVLKHGDSAVPVTFALGRSSTSAEIEVTNGIAVKSVDPSMGSGMGLSMMENLVIPVGGHVSSCSVEPGEWTTRLSIPLK